MNKNNFKDCNFPSLQNSELGTILEMKRIEEILKPTKEKLNFTPKLFTKTLKTKINTLKIYSIELISIFKNKGLNTTNKELLIQTLQKNPLGTPINTISKGIITNKFAVSNEQGLIQDLYNNENLKKEVLMKNIGGEIGLPLELYPNKNTAAWLKLNTLICNLPAYLPVNETQKDLNNLDYYNLAYNRILQLNFNRIIKHMNIFSKFDSELYTYQNVEYKFNNTSKYSNLNINSILQSTFLPMFSLTGKPYFYKSSNKVELRLDFFRGKSKVINTHKLGGLDFNSTDMQPSIIEKFNLLGNVLVNIFNKPVDLELNRLHVSFTNSTILSKVIGRFSKSRKYKRILDTLLRVARFKSPRSLNRYKENETISNIQSKSMIPSFMCGLKVRVGGRLLTQSVVPRRTVSIYQRGCLARGKANFVNTHRFTNKNKRGSYSITVTIANLFG